MMKNLVCLCGVRCALPLLLCVLWSNPSCLSSPVPWGKIFLTLYKEGRGTHSPCEECVVSFSVCHSFMLQKRSNGFLTMWGSDYFGCGAQGHDLTGGWVWVVWLGCGWTWWYWRSFPTRAILWFCKVSLEFILHNVRPTGRTDKRGVFCLSTDLNCWSDIYAS